MSTKLSPERQHMLDMLTWAMGHRIRLFNVLIDIMAFVDGTDPRIRVSGAIEGQWSATLREARKVLKEEFKHEDISTSD